MYKKRLIIALSAGAMWFTASFGWAATVRLAWDPSSESTVAGYNLYYGNTPRAQGAYTETVVISNRSTTDWVITLTPGVYYFALKAFDVNNNESGYCNEVMAEIPDVSIPGQPGKPSFDQ